ncbi:MAG: antirestriction protein ArdA [Oscillospiraceae bacterium]
MFEAKLKSRSQPKLGALAVTFPIPEERYENVILALQNLQIGDVRKQDCCIESIRAPDCPALLRMTNTMANVDELDWLGKQLESFDRYELLQFNAAVERFGLSAADELIDLSFCARDVTVVSDFNDLELVGKRHYLTVHGACDPKEPENLDGTETALALISGQPGYVTQFGVVYDNGIKLEQAYDRKHLPPIWMAANSILELKIRATGEDDPKKQEWVQLPASRMKLERAMLRAGIPSCGEMQMLVSDSRFPDEVECAVDFEYESLFELNRLCHACSGFKEQDFKKLGAVCQMAKPTCAANIRQLAENLDQFDFAPNVHTPEELGKYMIQQSGHYEYDENLEDFYNYGDYGVKRMLQEDGVFVDRGYVSYHGTLTLEELMRDDPAESYHQEQEANMEGMAW